MMTREELDTEIVVAISVFKAAKREELVKAVEDAQANWSDAETAEQYAFELLEDANCALASYDKENT